MYLLDTNILSHLIRDPNGMVRRRLAMAGQQPVATSIIVASELRFGAERRGSARLTEQVERVLQTIDVLPVGGNADVWYARIRTGLERRGTPIGANDIFIAAHALSLGATLVTDNEREFRRVEGLAVENWLRD